MLAQVDLVQIETVQKAPLAVLVALGVVAAAAVLGVAIVGSVIRRVASLALFAGIAALIVCLLTGADPFGIDLDFLRQSVEKVREIDPEGIPELG